MSSTRTMDVVVAGAGHVARNTVGITTIQQRVRSFLPRKIIMTLVAVGRSPDLSRRSSVKGVIVVIVGRGGDAKASRPLGQRVKGPKGQRAKV